MTADELAEQMEADRLRGDQILVSHQEADELTPAMIFLSSKCPMCRIFAKTLREARARITELEQMK